MNAPEVNLEKAHGALQSFGHDERGPKAVMEMLVAMAAALLDLGYGPEDVQELFFNVSKVVPTLVDAPTVAGMH